jgi:hypothetical protein
MNNVLEMLVLSVKRPVTLPIRNGFKPLKDNPLFLVLHQHMPSDLF